MLSLTSSFQIKKNLIESQLDELLPLKPNSVYNHLFEAARYALLGGGKRIRPLFLLTTVEIVQPAFSKLALIPACALEMIHTYSMIHDDLPCMDNDDYRRGRPTVHKKYSESHALLTGNFLLNYAFEVIAKSTDLLDSQKVALISTLSTYSGSEGILGGQVMDLALEGKNTNLKILEELHLRKSAALFKAALECGGMLANLDKKHLADLNYFGHLIGLAFQIVDDILDVTDSYAKHGKKESSDLVNKKCTYVTLQGLEVAQKRVQELYTEAKNTLELLPFASNALLELADFAINISVNNLG